MAGSRKSFFRKLVRRQHERLVSEDAATSEPWGHSPLNNSFRSATKYVPGGRVMSKDPFRLESNSTESKIEPLNGGRGMLVLFFFSISAAAITFGIVYSYGVRYPVLFLTKAFRGELREEQGDVLEKEGTAEENIPPLAGKLLWYPLRAVLFLGETYILAGWGAYCVLRAYEAIEKAGVKPGWGYHVTAFIVCIGALGYLARKEPRKDILSIIQSCVGMGSYIVYCITPGALATYYPWLLSFFRS